MTRFLLLIIIFAASLCGSQPAAFAAVYTPETVPNVQATDSTQYVSNPDGILSTATVTRLNAILRNMRHTTTAEAVVVVVDDIEGDDPDQFATELFDLWRPGKSDLDNGLIILVVKNLRKVTIRPGYGLEGVLPDITCARIIRELIAPEFREGNYDAGVTAAVEAVNRIVTNPDTAAEILSKEEDYNAAASSRQSGSFFRMYLYFAVILASVLLIWLAAMLLSTRRLDDHQRYTRLVKLRPIFLACTFLGIGIPIVASLPLVILLQCWRNKPRHCPRCGTKMNKLDEATDNQYLNAGQDLEERLGSVDYDVWLCPKCGETDILAYVSNSSVYSPCPRCGVRAYALRGERILRQSTTRQEGLGVRQYHCDACGYDHDENFTIPRKTDNSAFIAGAVLGAAAASASRRSGGFDGGGFGGGGFGGGGFGGGMTGGGGATGGW